MKCSRFAVVALSFFLPFAVVAEDAKPDVDDNSHNVAPGGFVALFNGKDLSGWRGLGHFDPRKLRAMSPADQKTMFAKNWEDVKKHWSVEDGELVNDGHGAYLTTLEEYGDYELMIDYKTVAKADSGIYMRMTPQVQIWDYTKEGGKWNLGADKGSGSLWNNAKGSKGKDALVLADKPFGEWNRLHIKMLGENVTVRLNDKLVVDNAPMHNFWDRKQLIFPVGSIQLQTHGGEIRWRNVFLREIPRELPAAGKLIDGKPAGDGWQPVFSSDSLDGWKHEPEYWSISDGVVTGKYDGGPLHHYMYSEKEYGDFEMHASVKMSGTNANSGVCIRTKPTSFDNVPGYQVDMGEGYWGCLWDERRDAMVDRFDPEVAKELVKADDWNHFYIVAKGHYIQGWLNGVKTIDVIHPRGETMGALGFQLTHGKNRKINAQFKDLWIRPVP
ncbi:MAG: 3-keto-disaccharide hydrolase [Planctomycetales bacterium]|jgi:hypothetical protein